MKICKVKVELDSETITCNAASLGDGKNGILYDSNKEQKISDVVDSRIKDANSLYNVFCLRPNDDPNDAVISKMQLINKVSKELVEYRTKSTSFLSRLAFLNKQCTYNPSIDSIKEVVDKKLRRALKSQYTFLVDLIDFLFQNTMITKLMTDKYDVNEFIKALNDDYNRKNDTKDSIIKSIENQKTNVLIDNDKLCLGDKQDADKKVLTEFLENYANNSTALTELFKTIEYEYFGIDFSSKDAQKQKQALFISPENNVDVPELFRKKLMTLYTEKIKGQTDSKKYYWFSLVHQYLVNEFVKKLYKNRKRYVVIEKNGAKIKKKYEYDLKKYTNSYVISKCHGMIKNYITSNYLQLGKSVYHFYDFNSDKFNVSSIDSFDYELVKAKDTLCQKIHTSIVFACHSFLCCMKNSNGQNANNDVDGKEIKDLTANDQRRLLRFFGGQSLVVKPNETIDTDALATELNAALYSVRNSHFHYSDEVKTEKVKSYPILRRLFEIEIEKQGHFILEKYLSNNVYMFYSESIVEQLFNQIYAKQCNVKSKPFIPAFSSILSFGKFDSSIIGTVAQPADVFKSTAYFLLKEIYYHNFISNDDVGILFVQALRERMENPKKEDNKDAWNDFASIVSKCGDDFPAICNCCMREYAIKNSKPENNKEQNGSHKGDYLKMFLNQITQAAFLKFVKDEYKLLNEPTYNEFYKDVHPDAPTVQISMNATEELLEWYALAKFIDPKELNMLRGNFAKYGQYIADIQDRRKIATGKDWIDWDFGKQVTAHFNNYEQIIQMLDLCRNSSGRITNEITDYYDDKEEYAKEMGCYLDYSGLESKDGSEFGKLMSFCYADDGKEQKQQVFMDEQKPILFATIEKARMRGADHLLHNVVSKINKTEFDNYVKLKESDDVKYLNALSALDNKVDIENKNSYNQIENRIKLHDVSRLSSLLYDLYSQLISYCYKWERDYGYFLMGFLYAKNDISELKTVKKIFIYGEKIKPISKAKHVGGKLHPYIEGKSAILQPQFDTLMRIDKPTNDEEHEEPKEVRNSIDHFNLLQKEIEKGKDCSLVEFYNYMTVMLGYDRKTQNDITVRLKNIFKRSKIKSTWKFIEPKSNFEKFVLNKMESDIFTHKIDKKDKKTWVKVPANSEIFQKQAKELLMYHPKRKK